MNIKNSRSFEGHDNVHALEQNNTPNSKLTLIRSWNASSWFSLHTNVSINHTPCFCLASSKLSRESFLKGTQFECVCAWFYQNEEINVFGLIYLLSSKNSFRKKTKLLEQQDQHKTFLKIACLKRRKEKRIKNKKGNLHDLIKMTEWMWPKFLNMTKKFTAMNFNMVNMTEKYI